MKILPIVSGTSASFGEHCGLVLRYDLNDHICDPIDILFNEEKKTMFRHSGERMEKVCR